MRNPFSSFPAPRFADRDEIVAAARQFSGRLAAARSEIRRIILFGSFARGDYGVRSDLDLLIVLERSDKPLGERLYDYLQFGSGYPTDILPLTEAEIDSRLGDQDPFLQQIFAEGIQLYP
jgi:predicted nucleotidyltransferase